MSFIKDLNAPLLRLGQDEFFYVYEAFQGVHGCGGIGSGKTSGSGAMIAGAYLRANWGGVVTAAQFAEIGNWENLSAQHGRSRSLVLFDENEGFNFLSYEMSRQGVEGVGTVSECLMKVIEAARRATGAGGHQGGGEQQFWEDSTRMCLRYSVLPLYVANGTVSVSDIIRFVSSAPMRREDVTSQAWQAGSFMYEVMDRAARRPRVKVSRETMLGAIEFWSERWVNTPEKTTGNIVMTVAAVLDRFQHGRLNKAFCGKTTIVPEMSLLGCVIVLAMPTLTWFEDGVIAQTLFKYMWQRAVLGRNALAPMYRERPVFLFSDESQETVSSFDGEFLSTCRQSLCAVTFMTQSLPAYYQKIGGSNPRDDAHALVGKFQTHVYHSNACPETNEYAAKMIGRVITRQNSYSDASSTSYNAGMSAGESENSGSNSSWGYSAGGASSSSGSQSGSGNNWGSNRGRGSSQSLTRGYSEHMEYAIEPGDFARTLLTGGKQNGGIVTAIWFKSGRIFKATGSNHMRVRFKQ